MSHKAHRAAAGATFTCIHCRQGVALTSWGTRHRNHCPYCLYSRHVDWKEVGDRLAVCRAEMQPIGLVLKATRKKYGMARDGELMLVHLCRECGKVSLNRLAADDDPERVWEIFESSFERLDEHLLSVELGEITLLPRSESELVETQLFGKRPFRLVSIEDNVSTNVL